MSDADKEQKTEAPTEKKLAKAAEKGQVASSPEVRHATAYIGSFFALTVLGATTAASLATVLANMLGSAGDWEIGGGVTPYLWTLCREVLLAVFPIFAVLIVAALLSARLQGRFIISWARVQPQWSRLSPFAGLKRMFQPVEFLKTLAKFAAVLTVVTVVLLSSLPMLDRTMLAEPGDSLGVAVALITKLLGTVLLLVVALAAADYFYQQYAFTQRMKMTRQEVKDEHKDSDGSPETKARIRRIQLQRAQQRMIQAVPAATVVVTNPTHYSVALTYDEEAGTAPRVVAKGVDTVALRIREVAREAGVPIVENVPLARALYAQVDLDRAIPAEHYVAVAEVISFVLKLRRAKIG